MVTTSRPNTNSTDVEKLQLATLDKSHAVTQKRQCITNPQNCLQSLTLIVTSEEAKVRTVALEMAIADHQCMNEDWHKNQPFVAKEPKGDSHC